MSINLHVHLANASAYHLCAVYATPLSRCAAYHFKCATQNSSQYVGKPQLVLRSSIIRKLHEVGQRILIENERELFVVARPVRDRRCYVQKDLEANLRRAHEMMPEPECPAGIPWRSFQRLRESCCTQGRSTLLESLRLSARQCCSPSAPIVC